MIPEIRPFERAWFRKKVLDRATQQVRDTMRFLDEHKSIKITNERGHDFELKTTQLLNVTKVVIFLAGRALPEECWRTRYHNSRSVGFIHIIAAHDYLGILETLRVPEDIKRYFSYREEVVPRLDESEIGVEESDIMGAFLAEEKRPSLGSRNVLQKLVQESDDFDLSRLIGNLHDHIDRAHNPYEYYRIMLEFARGPRSVWREIKLRFVKALEAARTGEFALPFRLAVPASDCRARLPAAH